MWPNLILGGAPKSGTSSLYFWLDAHPEVGSAKAKEPFFFFDKVNRFNEKANIHQHGLQAYPSLFDHVEDKKVVFEASAPYLYSRSALQHIPDLPSAPKVLFILREPSKRLHSKYRFNRYKLHNKTGDFRHYCSDQNGHFPAGQHVEEGFYSRFLDEWKKRLPEDRLKVLLMEDMMNNPKAFLVSLCQWLEIDPSFYAHFSFEKHNETFTTRSGDLHKKAVSWIPLVPEFLREPLGKLYRKLNAAPMPAPSAQELEWVSMLHDFYLPDRAQLQAQFPELPLHLWK